ncbi:MAG: polyhydroxyalkanoic acid system family protein [Bacteroidales bacterium]|nr:polyhydroxyalkanoic acid system family protein [Bacteroidales bacterium]
MPTIKVDVEHALNQEIATERVKGLLNSLKADYGDMIKDLKESWTGNNASFSFKVMGMSVTGNLLVTSAKVSFDGQIPFTAVPFKKTIENKIREEAIKLLA